MDYKFISVKLIAHSISQEGTPIATFELEYPRFIHSEIMTHRMFSRNAQSCLHGDSMIYFDLPGALQKGKTRRHDLKLSELFTKWQTPSKRQKISNMNIRCLNENTGELIHSKIKDVMYSGKKKVYEVVLEDGYKIKCSADHRIFTKTGWRTLKDMGLRELNKSCAIESGVLVACNGDLAYKNPDWLVSQRDLGKTLTQIATENNWNEKSVRHYAEKNKVSFSKAKILPNEDMSYKNKEWLTSARQAGLTCGRIAVMCNSTEDRVKHACCKLGVTGFVGTVLANGGTRTSWNKGLTYHQSDEALERRKSGLNSNKAHLNPNWKGGPSNYKDQNAAVTAFLNSVRKEKMEEAGWKCAVSNITSNLELHHVDPRWNNPDRALDPSNLIVLNKKVHRTIHANNLELEFKRYVDEGKDLKSFMDNLYKVDYKDIEKPASPGNKLAVRYKEIRSVTYIGEEDVYDIEVVGPYHNFVADGVVVHNSRAVPVAKTGEINALNPVKPLLWGKNKSGMSSTEELEGSELLVAKMNWSNAAEESFNRSKLLAEAGLHKQYANRLTEWCSRIKVVITATEWDNFFWLRDDPDAAQPEIVYLARKMQEVLSASTPELLQPGEWHTPYVQHERGDVYGLRYIDSSGAKLSTEEAKQISASCCAQVSYRTLNESKEKAIAIYGKLFIGSKPHLSPVEHQATPTQDYNYNDGINTENCYTWENGVTHTDRNGSLWSANFKGWIQYRQVLAAVKV
jgi:hypothetical protein